MRLKNKKTGEIVEWFNNTDGIFPDTLAELNEEWEDYGELKEYWLVNDLDGEPIKCELRYWSARDFDDWSEKRKQFGNYFETKEEAERAVEKLKAWKRLKDKGFEWQGWEEGSMGNGMCVIGCQIPENNWETDVVEDLDICFGGEE